MLRIPVEAGIAAGAPAWVELDLAALRHNVREFRRVLGPDRELVAVVKANAYGHGLREIAAAVLRAGAAQLAVADVAEGAALRAHGVQAPILVVGPMAPGECRDAVRHRLTPCLGSREQAEALAAAVRPGAPFPVHVEIDTGMHRHGVPAASFGAFVRELRARGRLLLTGVCTHFQALSPGDLPAMQAQLAAFARALALVRDLGTVLRHAANTLGTLVCPDARLDAVRIGGGLYGFERHGHGVVSLLPVLSLKARIVGLRVVEAGDSVGYGGRYRCTRLTRLGLLPVGYADGLSRGSWHEAPVLVRGRRVPIVGLVSMNQIVVDLTDVPEAGFGDEAVLIGRQGDDQVHAEERVQPGGSAYEVTTMLRRDLPRVVMG
ncbi:MAG: alanine racemase [Planctomycetes bacterium]|nr:alanine racemase [Planctomycetota bacterium]